MATTNSNVCWKCGATIDNHPLPLARIAECKKCRTDLCVCKMCENYDTFLAKSCREPVAEEIKDKERANFCDYFSLKANAYTPENTEATNDTRRQLDALFGDNTAESEESTPKDSDSQNSNTRGTLDDLFKSKD